MRVHHRFVRFGTRFALSGGIRDAADGAERDSPEKLFDNELAVDVGSVCWGPNQPLRVLDHHFEDPNRFPSASAAVLYNAQRIHDYFSSLRDKDVWVVTHMFPDFDALCSAYLARAILLAEEAPFDWSAHGLHPDKWYQTSWNKFPRPVRWQIALAATACYVDNCRPMFGARNRSLHSVLYAAIVRGRDYASRRGAIEFFDPVRARLEARQLNPLYDSVLEDEPEFAPELALLDRAPEAYNRDVRRARKAVVSIPCHKDHYADYSEFLRTRKTEPLLDDNFALRTPHVAKDDQKQTQVDGIYLRDPECLLFKEWARTDIENSSMGRGFLFTAIVYSGERPTGARNTASYYFALDPERAEGCHLYPLWARLQATEAGVASQPPWDKRFAGQKARPGFEERAGKNPELFVDPWFDAPNYNGTLVATPNEGTLLKAPPHPRADLTDDAVVAVVRRDIEHSMFAAPARIIDLATTPGRQDRDPLLLDLSNLLDVPPAAPAGFFRYGQVQLEGTIDIRSGALAEQIGRRLWGLLNPDERDDIPADFRERYLILDGNCVGVWSRQGVMLAFPAASIASAKRLHNQIKQMADLSQRVSHHLDGHGHADVEDADALLLRVAAFKHELARPEGRLLRDFFDAIGFGSVVETVRDLHAASLQRKVESLEIFILTVYVTELAHIFAELWLPEEHALALRLVSGLSGAFLIVAWFTLQPWRHWGGHKRLWLILFFVVALLATAFGLSWWPRPEKEKKKESPKIETTAPPVVVAPPVQTPEPAPPPPPKAKRTKSKKAKPAADERR